MVILGKPFFVAALFPYSAGWSAILLIIATCSVVGFAVFIERLWQLRRSEVDTDLFIVRLRQCIQEGNIVDAIQLCETTKGSIAHILKAGLAKHHRGQERIEAAMQLSGNLEIAQLEKNAKILSVIAHIAPLIGLLGTVLGFIQAFGEMRASGLVDISASRIGEAMEYALISTAAGLAVAIPTSLAYHYLVGRVEAFVLEMQTSSSEVVDLLLQRQEESSYR